VAAKKCSQALLMQLTPAWVRRTVITVEASPRRVNGAQNDEDLL